MGDVVSHPKFQRSADAPVNERARADRDRFISAQNRARQVRAAKVRSRLKSLGKIPPGLRAHFADHVHALFDEIEASGGSVAEALAAVQGGDTSTKRRGRFARRRDDRVTKTPLHAHYEHWITLIENCARILNRSAEQSIIALVEGTDEQIPASSDESFVKTTEDAVDVARHLNVTAGVIIRETALADYFEQVRLNDLELASDAGGFRIPDILVDGINWEEILDGHWTALRDGTFDALPKVKLYERYLPGCPATGTVGNFAFDNRPQSDDEWSSAAAHTAEPLVLEGKVAVWLAIAPIGRGGRPTAGLITKPTLVVPLASGERPELSTWFNAARGDRWHPYADDRMRWDAIRIHADGVHRDARAYLPRGGQTLIEGLTAETCHRALGRYDWTVTTPSIWGSLQDALDSASDAEVLATSAPTKTFLSIIQRNLLFADRDQSLARALHADAARLSTGLAALLSERRARFEAERVSRSRRGDNTNEEGGPRE